MPAPESAPLPPLISRREAVRRAAALCGFALSPALLEQALRAQTAAPGRAHLEPGPFAVMAAIAERILPRTDTPGAADVGVPAFLNRFWGECMSAREQALFTAGLADLEASSQREHGRGFTALTAAQQDELLRGVARAAEKQERTFFHLMREFTLLGYFTSETVGREVLHYDPVPGRWDACIPLAEVGNRAWTR